MEAKNERNRKRFFRISIVVIFVLALTAAAILTVVNIAMVHLGKENMLTPEEASSLENIDAILVLGCRVKDDGTPSRMLADRMQTAVDLIKAFQNDKKPVLLLSGDHMRDGYDEPGAMRQYALSQGIPDEQIREDPYGLSTYDSIWRLREIFGYRHIIIITQEYHLYRAEYIAEKLGIDCRGVAAPGGNYQGQRMRDIREVLARGKDYLMTVFKPKAKMGIAQRTKESAIDYPAENLGNTALRGIYHQ